MVVEEVSVTVWSVSSPGEGESAARSGGERREPGPPPGPAASVSGVSSTEMERRLRLSSLERLVEEAARDP
jgi:hypothetical protein